jgi:DNA-binding transcriptional LysR family regulator
MQRRYDQVSIPTEVVRTFVCAAQSESFTAVGTKLGLSQPAVSGHMKRLAAMTGGELFLKGGGPLQLTARGKLMLTHARKLLDANEQMLAMAGGVRETRSVRIGISPLYAERFMGLLRASGEATQYLYVHCEQSSELERLLLEGHLDIICAVDAHESTGTCLADWSEEYRWLKAKSFVLSPGSPLPLVCWPGALFDQLAIRACETMQLRYRVSFASHDAHARLAAAKAGLGLLASFPAFATADFIVAEDYYLPPLEPRRASVRARADFNTRPFARIIDVLTSLRTDRTASRQEAPDAVSP